MNTKHTQSANRVASVGDRKKTSKPGAGSRVNSVNTRIDEGSAAERSWQSLDAKLEAGAELLAKYLFHKTPMGGLRVPANVSAEEKLELLVEKCRKADGVLSNWHKKLTECHRSYIATSLLFDEDRTNAVINNNVRAVLGREDAELDRKIELARGAARKSRIGQTKEQRTDLIFKKLQIPSFGLLGKPWLTYDRIESAEHVDDLFRQAPRVYFEKAERIARAFCDACRIGVTEGFYGLIETSTDRTSLKYSFFTTEYTDVISQENISMPRGSRRTGNVVSETSATQRIDRVAHRHDLVSARWFRVDDALLNPWLDVPDHYLEGLENSMQLPRELACVVFGTQILERQVATELESEAVEYTSVLAEDVEIQPAQRELVRQLRVRFEPALVLFDSLVPFGWGAVAMKRQENLYKDHQRVLSENESARDKVRVMEISGLTLTCAGSVLLALTLFEALLLSAHSLLSAILIFFLPATLAVGLIAAGVDRRWRRTPPLREEAAKKLAEGLDELATKHPAFDPRKPRFPRGNG